MYQGKTLEKQEKGANLYVDSGSEDISVDNEGPC